MPRDVAVLVGSLRKESFTRKIANAIAELAPPSLQLEIVEIGDAAALQPGPRDRRAARAVAAFRDRVAAPTRVLFVTPEYNRSVPGVLKNAIDVGSRPYGKSAWNGKPAAVVSVSPGAIGAFGANHHLRQSLVFLDMPACSSPRRTSAARTSCSTSTATSRTTRRARSSRISPRRSRPGSIGSRSRPDRRYPPDVAIASFVRPACLRALHHVHDAAVRDPLVGLEHDLRVLVARERGAEQVVELGVGHRLAADVDVALDRDHEHERRLRRIDLLRLARRQVDLDARTSSPSRSCPAASATFFFSGALRPARRARSP